MTATSILSHLHPTTGRLRMVNVSAKPGSVRRAIAKGRVSLQPEPEAYWAIKEQLKQHHQGLALDHAKRTSSDTDATSSLRPVTKGDLFTVAQIAGIQAAKQTATLIPLCHPLSAALAHVDVSCRWNDDALSMDMTACCTTTATATTGVEMEALTAVSVAGLTLIDMCKASAKRAILTDVRVVRKEGGTSGTFINDEDVV